MFDVYFLRLGLPHLSHHPHSHCPRQYQPVQEGRPRQTLEWVNNISQTTQKNISAIKPAIWGLLLKRTYAHMLSPSLLALIDGWMVEEGEQTERRKVWEEVLHVARMCDVCVAWYLTGRVMESGDEMTRMFLLWRIWDDNEQEKNERETVV